MPLPLILVPIVEGLIAALEAGGLIGGAEAAAAAAAELAPVVVAGVEAGTFASAEAGIASTAAAHLAAAEAAAATTGAAATAGATTGAAAGAGVAGAATGTGAASAASAAGAMSAKELAAAIAEALKGPKQSLLKQGLKWTGGSALGGGLFIGLNELSNKMIHGSEGGGYAGGDDGMAQIEALMRNGGGGVGGGETGFEPGGSLRSQYFKSKGAVGALNNQEMLSMRPPTSGFGSDLDVLTKGYEDMLDQIAHKQQMTYTEAAARSGFVLSKERMM